MIRHVIQRLSEIRRLNKASKYIVSSGVADLPFIKLADGKIFYGLFPTAFQSMIYYLLKKDLRKKVRRECVNVLFDVLNRYLSPFGGVVINLKEGDVVIEVGAYLGFYVVGASVRVGDVGKVIAIEAVEDNYRTLKRNVFVNNLKNVVCINKAAWRTRGALDLYVTNRQANSAYPLKGSAESIEVPCDTLDNIIEEQQLQHVDFVRIMVNGAEADVLEGFSSVRKFKPVMSIAVPYNKRAIEKVRELGYDYKIKKPMMLAWPG